MTKGKIITFEGIDCCGKGTQVKNTSSYLSSRGIDNIVAREPGTTSLGATLRMILKHPGEVYEAMNQAFGDHHDFQGPLNIGEDTVPKAETLMFLAARADLVEHVISPTVHRGISVILDRFRDSTRAYQGGGRYKSDEKIIDAINRINDFVIGDYQPDRTFFLHIPFEVMLHRAEKDRRKKDYFESQGRDFYERIISEYNALVKEEPQRVVLVDGTKSPEEVFKDIVPYLDELFGIN